MEYLEVQTSWTLKDTQYKEKTKMWVLVLPKLFRYNYTHQYGVPIKDFLFITDAFISAATPKSAKGENKLNVGSCSRQVVWETRRRPDWPSLTSPLSVRRMLAPCRAQNKTISAYMWLDSYSFTNTHTQTCAHTHTGFAVFVWTFHCQSLKQILNAMHSPNPNLNLKRKPFGSIMFRTFRTLCWWRRK